MKKILILFFITCCVSNVFAQITPMFKDDIDANLKTALILLAKKADAGDGLSQMRLALQYYSGENLIKDDQKAVKYLKEAIKNKTPQAEDALKIIEFNLGVLAQKAGQNLEATSHFKIAADLGDVQAKEHLEEIKKNIKAELSTDKTVNIKQETVFNNDVQPNFISACYEYVFTCLDDIMAVVSMADFSRQKIALAYGDITVSKSSNLFTIHDLDPVTAEAVYRGLVPNHKLRVTLQEDGKLQCFIFTFR